MRANAGCSTEYVCDGGGRGPCEKVAKTVREVQCLHVGGSGGVGSSGAGGVVVVAVVVAAVWRCWCYFGVYARVYWWDTHFGGAVVLALSPVTSHSLYSPRLSSLSPSRRPSYRKRPSQARHYARWLCVANERPTNQTGKRQPGDKRNMLLRDRRARP